MNELLIAQLLQIIANSKLFSELTEQTVISDDSFFASINTGQEDAKKIKLPLLRGYSGDWNASTNTPALANGTGLSATVYRVSVAGTRDLGNGAVTYGLEEIIYYNGSKWVKLIQSQISDIQGLQAALNNHLLNTTDRFTGVLTIDGNLDINENTKLRFYAPNTSGNPGSGFPQLEGKMYGVENQGVRLDTPFEVIGPVTTSTVPTLGGHLTNLTYVNGLISAYALSSSIPTNNNQLTNGAGYTGNQDLSAYALSSSIPTNNNQLTNGAGYTGNQDLSAYALSSSIPTNNNQLTNGAGYTGNQDLSAYRLVTDSFTKTQVNTLDTQNVKLTGVQTIAGAKTFSSAATCNSTVTATNFILSSDKRLKIKSKKVESNKIDVNWKTFEFKSEKGQNRYGVIAQELEEVHPEFVRTDEEGMKSVAYIDLLIAKIAELEARLEKAGI
jgi:hypothetical protein